MQNQVYRDGPTVGWALHGLCLPYSIKNDWDCFDGRIPSVCIGHAPYSNQKSVTT